MSSKMGKVLIILLAVNIAATLGLGAFFYLSSEEIKHQQVVLERRIKDIEPCEDNTDENLALISAVIGSELETKVDEVTEQISQQIEGIEGNLAKYDEGIAEITAGLEELNNNMQDISRVITSVQEILDSIKDFLKIG